MSPHDLERPILHSCVGLTVIGFLLVSGLIPGGAASAEPLPTVSQTLTGTPFAEKHARMVVAGKIAITTVDESSTRELVVGLACLMPKDGPAGNPFAGARPLLPAALVNRFEVIEPGRADEAIQKLTITEEAVDELRRYPQFEPGIGLNLSPAEQVAFAELATAHPGRLGDERIAQEVRRRLLERFTRYHQEGLEGIEPYVRAGDRLAQPAEELRRALHQAHAMEQRFPDYFQFWNRYPRAELPDAGQHYFWIQSTIRSRPALILGHKVEWRQGNVHMVGERHFYISHFFNGGYMVGFMIPVQEGTLIAMIERLWVDGYSGMEGLKRTFGRKMIASNLRDESLQRNACRGH